MTNTPNKIKPLAAMADVLLLLSERIEQPMNIQQAAAFMVVAAHEGEPLSIGELGQATDMTTSTASHTVAVLSEFKAFQQPGQGLLIVRPDLVERRKKLVSLAPFGVKTADELRRRLARHFQ